MQKLIEIPDDAPEAMRESLEAHNAPIIAAEEKREAWIAAQKAISDDADLNGAQKREKFDALTEFVRLGGDASTFERAWPGIRKELLVGRLTTVDAAIGAARRVKF